MDGLLSAFEQLTSIQQQLQQECRQCKVALFKLQARPNARRRRAAAGAARATASAAAAAVAAPASAPPPAVAAAAVEEVQEQLAELNQLRTSADDAQDFLLGLVQQLLQVRVSL